LNKKKFLFLIFYRKVLLLF